MAAMTDLVHVRSAPSVLDRPEEMGGSTLEDMSSDDSVTDSEDSEPNSPAAQPKVAERMFKGPKIWMLTLGVALACCAGAVNVIVYRGLDVLVSHVTGSVSKVAERLEGVRWEEHGPFDALHLAVIVGSFIFGAFLCGLIIPKNQVHFGGKSFYGTALLGNSALLIAATLIAPPKDDDAKPDTGTKAVLAGCLAAMACGLQNAMCTMHFGTIVRTTHVTGTATDIGSTAGRAVMILLRNRCRPRKASEVEQTELVDDAAKLFVLISIFTGFFLGTILGAFLERRLGIHALFVPAGFTGLVGFVYVFFRTTLKGYFERFERKLVRDEVKVVTAALGRARRLLHDPAATEDLADLESLVDRALSNVQEMEATLEDLEDRDQHVARNANQQILRRTSTM